MKGIETKGVAFHDIIINYQNIFMDKTSTENIGFQKLRDIRCGYLHRIDVNFYCTEKIHKNKRADLLGDDPDKVFIFCQSCQDGKSEEQIKEDRRLFNREQRKRLLDLRRMIIKITRSGFQSDVFMCSNKADEDSLIIFSRDGERLSCPNVKNALIDIKEVCMKTMNAETGLPPCKFLIIEQHIVKLDIEKTEESERISKGILALEDKKQIEAQYKEV